MSNHTYNIGDRVMFLGIKNPDYGINNAVVYNPPINYEGTIRWMTPGGGNNIEIDNWFWGKDFSQTKWSGYFSKVK
jgi:hypothetical protein